MVAPKREALDRPIKARGSRCLASIQRQIELRLRDRMQRPIKHDRQAVSTLTASPDRLPTPTRSPAVIVWIFAALVGWAFIAWILMR